MNYVEVSEDIFVRAVKGSKKNSASSVFSGRTHAVYKCSISSGRMLRVLVMFYNMILIQNIVLFDGLKCLKHALKKARVRC